MDSEPRVEIQISADLARQVGALVEQLKRLHPEDDPTFHYALGYAVSSGHISVSDDLARRAKRGAEITAPPSPRPPLSAYRTLANPRAQLSGAGA